MITPSVLDKLCELKSEFLQTNTIHHQVLSGQFIEGP